METYMLVDIDKCWGCKACQVACKQEHGTPPGEGSIDVVKVERQMEQPQCDYVPVLCQHCDDPRCADACPVGAIIRDEEGLVQLDQKACTGCGACVEACPYGAVFLRGNDAPTAEKCDLCADRRGRGFLTACEQHCLGQVFTSCGKAELADLTKGRYHWGTGRVTYVSSKLPGIGRSL